MNINNPKNVADRSSPVTRKIYDYYAGYSYSFAESLVVSLGLTLSDTVLDPWNGGGTTTSVINGRVKGIGLDLNPAMVVIAKAGAGSKLDVATLRSKARSLGEACLPNANSTSQQDPLERWMVPTSARYLRRLSYLIIGIKGDLLLTFEEAKKVVEHLDPCSSLLLVALFKATRRLLQRFVPTNPTWVTRPETASNRIRPTPEVMKNLFMAEVETLISLRLPEAAEQVESVSIKVGDATCMDIPDETVDCIITSPPYCTRIDYAVATSIELAVLGLSPPAFDTLRRRLMGTSTVSKNDVPSSQKWGDACLRFLEAVRTHDSKASSGYYFKSHCSYFSSLFAATAEIARVLSLRGKCFMVVQDSFYKEIHNDLQAIVIDMMGGNGITVRPPRRFFGSHFYGQYQ